MRRPLVIFAFCNRSLMDSLIHEENYVFFFISAWSCRRVVIEFKYANGNVSVSSSASSLWQIRGLLQFLFCPKLLLLPTWSLAVFCSCVLTVGCRVLVFLLSVVSLLVDVWGCWLSGLCCRLLTVDYRLSLSVVVVGSWLWGAAFRCYNCWLLESANAHFFYCRCPAMKDTVLYTVFVICQ